MASYHAVFGQAPSDDEDVVAAHKLQWTEQQTKSGRVDVRETWRRFYAIHKCEVQLKRTLKKLNEGGAVRQSTIRKYNLIQNGGSGLWEAQSTS